MAKAAPKPKKVPARRAESVPAKKTATKSTPSNKAAPARPSKAPSANRSAAPVRKSAAGRADGAAKKPAARATTKAAAVKPARETAAKTPAKKAPAKTATKATRPKAGPDAAVKAAPKNPEPASAETAKTRAAKPGAVKPEAVKPEAVKPEAVKKAAPPRKTTVICPLSGFEVKPDKPNLSPRTVERLRTKLLDERSRHIAQAEQLQAEAAQLALDREEGDTQFDEEGGEGDTISVERERDLMLSASARQIVEEIDGALERIKNKTYGLCTPAGRRISVERLEALPYADTCVDCKARAERRR
jgi:RNA polymerase-binding transcription factor DksA